MRKSFPSPSDVMRDDVHREQAIDATLRELHAEQRSIHAENQLIHNVLNEAITLLMQRVGKFEARVDVRLDQQRQEIGGRL